MDIRISKQATRKDPEALRQETMRKEATVSLALKSPFGLAKLASALVNPVRKYLDYVPIGRKTVVVEPIPDGFIPYFDADIEEFYGTKVGADGVSKMLICNAIRTVVDEFEVITKPKVPYKELRVRKYKVLDRVKERLKQGLGLREDNLWFSLFHTAGVATNTEQVITGKLTKDVLALAFKEVERHRLVVSSVILNPQAVSGIRRWQRTDIDEAARIEIRQRGYLGSLFGANFFVSNIINIDATNDTTFAYILAQPQFVGWMPIRADAEIIPADRPDDVLLGWVGYELLGMLVHNNRAVARIKFSSTS